MKLCVGQLAGQGVGRTGLAGWGRGIMAVQMALTAVTSSLGTPALSELKKVEV